MSRERTRRNRLSRSADFDRVYRRGRSAPHRMLVIYRFDRPDDVTIAATETCRVGITVSRKLGNAVTRNQLKRQLREALSSVISTTESIDIVAVARPGLVEAIDREGFSWLVDLVRESAGKLGVAADQAPNDGAVP